jgi:hypothetical protein
MSESSTSAVEPTRGRSRSVGHLAVSAYVLLGCALLWSRLTHLGKSFWFDESVFVGEYVRRGPHAILAGPGLSHELYGLLLWLTSQLAGESETVYRLWSVLPFIAGVAVVTAWLHVRVGKGSGVLFLFFATISPLLLDITRQARGYGLAFLAMAIVVVAALEAEQTGRTRWVALACAGGVVGSWTLPQFTIGFVAVTVVLAANPALRRSALVGTAVSCAAIVVWFSPHFHQVQTAAVAPPALQGQQIATAWLLFALFGQVLLPALLWIDPVLLIPTIWWIPIFVFAAVIMSSSPLLRERRSALILSLGPVATVVVLWAGDAYVVPRYLSFLLVPLFVLLATGASDILAGIPKRRAPVRSLACLVVLVALALNFARVAPDVVRLPKEAARDAVDAIDAEAPPGVPVLTRVHLPQGLVFYLGRPVRPLEPEEVVPQVCRSRETVAYVVQPFYLRPVTVPCLSRPGVRHFRFAQYTNGNETDVWIVPSVH